MAEGLSADGIAVIIDACAKGNVASLTYGELHISFFQVPTEFKPYVPSFPEVEVAHGDDAQNGMGVSAQVQVEKTPEEEQLLEDVRLGQLMVDDPAAYEQEMMDLAGEDTDAD